MRVNVLAVRQVPSLTPGRIGKQDTLVDFGIEGEGNDFVVIAEEDPDERTIQDAIKAKVGARSKQQGTSFEL